MRGEPGAVGGQKKGIFPGMPFEVGYLGTILVGCVELVRRRPRVQVPQEEAAIFKGGLSTTPSLSGMAGLAGAAAGEDVGRAGVPGETRNSIRVPQPSSLQGPISLAARSG